MQYKGSQQYILPPPGVPGGTQNPSATTQLDVGDWLGDGVGAGGIVGGAVPRV